MLRKVLTSSVAMSLFLAANSQDSTKSLPTISGSVDAYYRFDFAGKGNNLTSFTNSNNSFELGMATLRVDHSIGKVSATADLGFGRRAAEFSYNDSGSLASVKQLYITYAPSDKIKFTMGKFATHIGYELVDAVANRNYSMSYGFSYGPFFHTGLKADVSLGGKTAFMVGISNPTDLSSNPTSNQYVIAQLSTATKNDKLKAYLNYQGTSSPGFKLSQFDLVLLGAINSKFAINYDGTVQSRKFGTAKAQSWSSNAFYFNYDPTSTFGLTLRTEFLSDKDDLLGLGGERIFIPTLSANFKVSALTIIPEIRLDNAKNNIFEKSNGTLTKGATSFVLAATYKF